VGSGIIWDSKVKQEWQECEQKCRFLVKLPGPEFELIESMLLHKGSFFLLRYHWNRIKESAKQLGFSCSYQQWQKVCTAARARCSKKHSWKVRIVLDSDGHFDCSEQQIQSPVYVTPPPVYLFNTPIDADNLFLYHKTTRRWWYDAALEGVAQGRWYDLIYYNTHQQLTEGGRSNLFIKRDGVLYTPPRQCGLLTGTFREDLLRRGQCVERIINRSELSRDTELYMGNSVRGLVRVCFAGVVGAER
jgi:para-aminobenzoate synthetase/4-amino-4-deoxychorismate lyase